MAFNRDNRSGGRRDFGRRSFDGGRGGDRQMFKTTCSKCGKDCEVPFQPTGSKPVYCSDCFRNMGSSDSRHSNDRGSRRPSFDNRGGSVQPQYKEEFEGLNSKLDRILKLLGPEETTAQAPKIETVKKEEPQKKKAAAKKKTALPTPSEADIFNATPTK